MGSCFGLKMEFWKWSKDVLILKGNKNRGVLYLGLSGKEVLIWQFMILKAIFEVKELKKYSEKVQNFHMLFRLFGTSSIKKWGLFSVLRVLLFFCGCRAQKNVPKNQEGSYVVQVPRTSKLSWGYILVAKNCLKIMEWVKSFIV